MQGFCEKLLKSRGKEFIDNQLSCIICIELNLDLFEFKNMSKDWYEMNVYKCEKFFLFHLLCQLKEPKLS